MRSSVFAVAVLVSASSCKRDAPAPAAVPLVTKQQAGVPLPPTSRWTLDPENSSASFSVKHVLSTVRGMFQRPSGTVTFDDANPANSRVEATIEVNTVTTGVEERDTHLKSSEFFDAAKNPVMTFVSTSVRSTGDLQFEVIGDLSMHGFTKPVTLAVTATPAFNHAGGVRRGIEATGTVNRRDFGLTWDFPGEGTGVVVGDLIKITIDAELVLVP